MTLAPQSFAIASEISLHFPTRMWVMTQQWPRLAGMAAKVSVFSLLKAPAGIFPAH